jgi:exonuclease III
LLTIINVYASQTSTERALLWNRIAQADFISDHIILGGDFNHFDQGNTLGSRRMHRREVAAWHRMTLRYGLTDAWLLDSFHKQSEKEFTFDNGRTGRQSAVSRIDKFMVSQTVEERGGRIEVAASMRKLTNHSPVCIKI